MRSARNHLVSCIWTSVGDLIREADLPPPQLGLSVPAAWKGAVRPSSVKTAPQESNGTCGHLRLLKIGALHQSA